MKKSVSLLLASLMALSLTACGGGSAPDTTQTSGQAGAAGSEAQTQAKAPEGTTEVVFWHSFGGALGEEVQKIVDEYNAGQGAEKKVFVNAVFQGYEGTDKVILAYQTKDVDNACDINIGLTSTIPSMLSLDWTKKVSDMMAKGDAALSEEDFYPSMVRSVSYENEMVGLPLSNSTMVMYYNADALKEAGFDKAPETMDELVQYVEALTQKDASGNVTRYGLECQVKRYQLVNFIVSQSENAFFGDMEGGRAGAMTRLTCGEDGTLGKFLDKWEKLLATGGYQYLENNLAEEFSAGITAMGIMSSSKCTTVANLVGDSFEWATAPIPKVNAGDTSGAAVGGSCMILFDRGDEARLNGAWDFMQYLSTPESQYRISTNSGYIPTVKATEELPEMKAFYEEHPQYLTAQEVIKTSSPMAQEPMDLCYNEINSVITDLMLQFCQGDLTKEEAEKQIVDQCNKLLDEWHEAND